ncbi:MAG: hypothetical protein BWX93_00421 [Bacteroidetes bacterium ADurb.Bin139]|nr:MAG: hypothetical protein BWX93_00421 [Bacteroidetes bacterium ADurb.Bin139]
MMIMKRIFNRGFLPGLASLLMIVAGIMLISGCVRKSMQKEMERVVEQVLAYSTRTIEPELKLLRVTLDRALTDKEKQQINQYREQAKIMIDSMINFQMKLSELKGGQEYKLSEDEIAYYNRSQKNMRQIITSCWEVLDNHEEDFALIQREMYPKTLIWQREVMDIVSKNLPAGFRDEFATEGRGLQIIGMDRLSPNNMQQVFFILYEPKTNFPLNKLKDMLQRMLKDNR